MIIVTKETKICDLKNNSRDEICNLSYLLI